MVLGALVRLHMNMKQRIQFFCINWKIVLKGLIEMS